MQGEPKPKYRTANLGEKNQLYYDKEVSMSVCGLLSLSGGSSKLDFHASMIKYIQLLENL